MKKILQRIEFDWSNNCEDRNDFMFGFIPTIIIVSETRKIVIGILFLTITANIGWVKRPFDEHPF